MTFRSLLPGHASPFRRTVEEASAKRLEIEFALRSIDDAERVPEQFIPFLAWGLSTDLWDRNWSIERKRAVAKAWWDLHRRKGTLTGIKDAVRFFGAEVVAARRPPDATYPDPAMSRQERDAYLERFRQIRLYAYRSGGTANYGAFIGSGYRLPRLFIGSRAFPTFTDAPARIGKRAFIFDPATGDEVAVKQVTRVDAIEERSAVEFDQISLPGSAGKAAFVGRRPIAKVFTMDVGSGRRTYSVRVDTTYRETTSALHISGIEPSAQPIDVRTRKARLPGQRVLGQLFPKRTGRATEFINRPSDGVHRAFLPPSTAHLRIFDQIFLFEEDRQADRRGARTFIGNTRLGMPAYHARLTLEMPGNISPFAVQRFVRGFLMKTDKSRLKQAIDAVRVSKSLRDDIVVTAKTMRPARVGDGLKIGTISVGTWVRDL